MKDKIDILNEPSNQATCFETFSHIRREFELNAAFDFVSGTLKIKRPADVAYIFRKLENKAVENSFAVLVKDGEPTVLHLATGNATEVSVDYTALVVAVDRINPDQIYFIHNHPSGNLIASNSDIVAFRKLQGLFGEKLQPGIVININSGKFAVYDEYGNMGHELPQEYEQNAEIPLTVYSFSKLVFDKSYNPEKNFRITESKDVAQFVSSHRTGERNKMNFFALRSDGGVVGNLFLPYTGITYNNVEQIATDIVLKTMTLGAVFAVPYGRFSGVNLCDTLLKKIKEKSLGSVKMLDAVYIEKKNDLYLYASWGDHGGFANRIPTEGEFSLFSVAEQELKFSNKKNQNVLQEPKIKYNYKLQNQNTMEQKNTKKQQHEQTAVAEAPNKQVQNTKDIDGGLPKFGVTEQDSFAENAVRNFVNTYEKMTAKVAQNRKIPKNKLDEFCELLKQRGLPLDQMAKNGDLEKLATFKKTDNLYEFPKTFTNEKDEEINYNSQARVSINASHDNETFELKTHERQKKIQDKYFNHKFTPEQREHLQKYGTAGQVISITFNQGEEPVPVIITVDKKTNQLVTANPEKIRISNEFLGVPISPEQQQLLKEGKMVQLDGMVPSTGKEINAPVFYDADRRGLSICFEQATHRNSMNLTEEQKAQLDSGETIYMEGLTNKNTAQKYDTHIRKSSLTGELQYCKTGEFRLPTHQMNNEQKQRYEAGEKVEMDNLIDDKGQLYTAFVRKNPETGKTQTSKDGTFTPRTDFKPQVDANNKGVGQNQRQQKAIGKGAFKKGAKISV